MYHQDSSTPRGDVPRGYGPLARFDPHTSPPDAPAVDPAGRSVLYVGQDLAASACEVFGEAGEALLCPAWRVAMIRPTRPQLLFNLEARGSAMAIGALPSLADGSHPRALTRQWARAIYEDDPTGRHVDGIRYRTGYDGGIALALWDCAGQIAVVTGAAGTEQDFPLTEPSVLHRLMVAMATRHVTVTVVATADCPKCP